MIAGCYARKSTVEEKDDRDKSVARQITSGVGSSSVLSLQAPPERAATSARLRRPVLPSRGNRPLGLRGLDLSGPPHVHLRYGPVTPAGGRAGVADKAQGSVPPVSVTTGGSADRGDQPDPLTR